MSDTRSAADIYNRLVEQLTEKNYGEPMPPYWADIVATLAEAGYTMVDRERFGRLRTAARIAVRYVLGDDVDLSREIAVDDLYLLPGDLDSAANTGGCDD